MWNGRWLDATSRIECVAIVGGTHGNESNGVYLQRALKASGVCGEGFDVVLLEANPEAVRLNRRYVDVDLNRCFLEKDLYGEKKEGLEWNRAQEIDRLIGPKKSQKPRADLVIDLHNTTSNTGVALMMHPKDEFSHALAAHLQRIDPSVRVCNWLNEEPPLLPSIGRSGCTFEVGPAPWGVVVPQLFSDSLRLLQATLSYVAAHNASVDGTAPLPTETRDLEVFTRIREIPFPRSPDGDLSAMLHPNIHAGDFGSIRPGDPLFRRWDGSDIPFQGPEDDDNITFLFANEAAYYEKNVAVVLSRRNTKPVQTLRLS